MNFQKRIEFLLEQEQKRHKALKAGNTECPVPPYHIYAETTNACMLDCVFCTDREKRGKIGRMKFEVWKIFADQLAKYKVLSPIVMIGRGEPTCHTDLVEFVRYGSSVGLNCSIITNGVILDKKRSKELLDAGIKKIQFSFHSHSKESYIAQTRHDYYDQVKQNIHDLVELNDKMGKPCWINVMSVENSYNKHESEGFLKYWEKHVDHCFVTPLYSVQGQSRMADEANDTTFSQAEEGIVYPGCVNPWIFFGIRLDGDAVVCPYDFTGRHIVGNIMEGDFDLMEMWNNDKVQSLRKCHTTCNFDYADKVGYTCKECDIPFAADSYKGIPKYCDNFPIAFSRVFGPVLRG